jgi:hypothetical protein
MDFLSSRRVDTGPPEAINKPQVSLNDISVLSKACDGRSLDSSGAVTWRNVG